MQEPGVFCTPRTGIRLHGPVTPNCAPVAPCCTGRHWSLTLANRPFRHILNPQPLAPGGFRKPWAQWKASPKMPRKLSRQVCKKTGLFCTRFACKCLVRKNRADLHLLRFGTARINIVAWLRGPFCTALRFNCALSPRSTAPRRNSNHVPRPINRRFQRVIAPRTSRVRGPQIPPKKA